MKELAEKIALYFIGKDHKIGEIVLDAFLSESHEFKAEATEHPLESGSSFVDHIQNKAITLSLDGIISNTPMTLTGLTAFRSAQNWLNNKSNDLSQKAFESLEIIFKERRPIIISTSLKDYENMVLESLCIEKRAEDVLRFKCTAKQIRIVELNRIKIPKPKVERAKPKKNLGKQEAKELPKADVPKVEAIKKETSFLKSWFK